MAWKIAPLHASFMLAAIIGFFLTAFWVKDLSWKFTLLLVFAVMFIAAFISMTKAPIIKKEIRRRK
jgi:hypothetical protein